MQWADYRGIRRPKAYAPPPKQNSSLDRFGLGLLSDFGVQQTYESRCYATVTSLLK